MLYWILGFTVALAALAAALLFRKRGPAKPSVPKTYSGPIRFTHPDGRNMKIVRKDDGSFETLEE